LGLSKDDRYENCERIARLAKVLEEQGHFVIVSVIAPYEELREYIKTLCGCTFVYIPGGAKPSPETPYEVPKGVPVKV
jgi:adenylylsulfate kinase-like enzyme